MIVQTKFNPLKWNWDKVIFKQIFSYGIKFQFISLAALLNEPITKILLGKFGGMGFVGYYEMANRLLMQAKGVIVSGTQSLMPVMVNLSKNVRDVQNFYRKISSNVLFFALASTCIIMLSGRLVSAFWIGSYQPTFYYTLIILSVSLFLNLFITPFYFYYMSQANLNFLIKNHVLLGASNAIIGGVLGYFIGGYGVVYGWFAANMIGSLYIMFNFGKSFQIGAKQLLNRKDIYFAVVLIIIVLFNTFHLINISFKLLDVICLLIAVMAVCIYFFKFKLNDIRGKHV